MSTDRIAKGVIDIEARADGVDATITKVESAFEDLGRAGQQAGADASSGIAKIGDGAGVAGAKVVEFAGRAKKSINDLGEATRRAADGSALPRLGAESEQSSKRIEASTRSITNAIQRQIAMLEAGGKATSDYYSLLAQQRGVDPGRLKPYLDQLDAVNSRHRQAGQTSGEMAAAMRTLPAQFTDIATSIASGQDPMLVLLQQGGQLKDMFGGVGPAIRAMGGYIAGLVNPLTVSAAAVAALTYALYAGGKEAERYANALLLTNNAAGTSADQMAAMAASIDAYYGTQAAAAEAVTALAGTGEVSAKNLERFASVTMQWSDITGESVEDVVDKFKLLGKDPVDASLKLDESARFLTASLYEQITALVEQGKETEAANLAQNAFADTLAKRTTEMQENLGLIERAWIGIKKSIKEAGDELLSVGRTQSYAQQLAAINRKLMTGMASESGRDPRILTDGDRKALQEQARNIEQAMAADRKTAAVQAQAEAERQDSIQLRRENDAWEKANRTRQQRRDQELADQRKFLDKGVITQEQYAARVTGINKKYAEKPSTRGARQAEQVADAYGDMERSLRKQLLTEQELTVAEKVRMDLTDKRYKHLSTVQKGNLIALAQEVDAFNEQKQLFKDIADFAKEYDDSEKKRLETAVNAAEQSRKAVESQVAQLQQEADTYGLSAAGVQDYLLAKAEERLALEKSGEAREGVIEQIEREIAERRKLADLQRGKDVREAGEEAAKRAAEEWQKSADQINQSLTDALMRGFEDGKGFAENFADSLKSTFATMVLRPAVQAVVQPMAGAVNATLYGGQGGVGGMFSAGGFGVGSAAGLGSLVGSFGNLTGSATTSAYGTGMGLGAADAEAAANAFRTSGMNDVADSLLAGQKMASTVGKVANVAGYAMAAYNGIKAIEQGRWGAAAGTAIGAFTPLGPLGAAIGGQLGGLLDGAFGGGGGQKFGGEGAIGRSTAGLFPEGQTDAQVQSALDAFGTGLKEVAQKFGAQLGDVQFAFGYETDPQGDAGNFFSSKLAVDGVTVRDINVVKFDGDAEAKMAAEFKLATVLALKQANLAPELQQAFEGFDPATAVAADVDKVMARLEQMAGVQKAFEGLALAMPELSKLTLAAKEHIVQLAGGVDALTGAAQSYYQGYYTEAERLALTSQQVSEALGKVGVAMPATREEYRKQVEALDLSSDAGRKAYAAMLGLAGAFGTVADAGKSAAEEMAQVAQQRLADAESVLRTAYDRESSALKSTADRLQAFTRSLRDFRQSLTLGELSTLSPEGKYSTARDEFDKVLAAAAAGDEEAQDRLAEVAQAYLEASRAYNASSAQYVDDYNRVQSALLMLEATGKAAETVARQQLTLMQKQVGALLKLDDSVISVRDAVARLYMLRAESGTVEPITPIDTTQPGTVGDSLLTNLNALYQQVLGRDVDMSGLHYYSGQLGAGKTLDWVYRDILASDEAKRRILDGSHAGGLATVPFDGYVAELHAGERVLTAQQSREYAAIDWSRFGRGGSDALVAEVKALRAEVAALRADNAADAAAGRRQAEAVARATLAQGGRLAGALDRAAADRI